MSILITGATGYIGSHLTQTLIDQGHSIRILCRSIPTQSLFHHPSIEMVMGDINNQSSLEKAMKNIKQVYHLAAYARLWAKDPQTFHRINVDGTKNVLEAALQAGVEKIVYTSTAGVIGPSFEFPMREDIPRVIPFFNAYEETKTISEAIVREYVQKGLFVTIVNPARVYGPGLDCGSNPVTKIIELYLKGRWRVIPGTGEDIGSYCYIDDVVSGHIAAMDKGKIGERYIFGGVNISFNELMKYISQISGQHYRMVNMPFPILVISSKIMTRWSKWSGKPPMITPEWVKRYKYHWALNSEKAVNQLGYKIRPIEDGLLKTIEWLKTNRIKHERIL